MAPRCHTKDHVFLKIRHPISFSSNWPLLPRFNKAPFSFPIKVSDQTSSGVFGNNSNGNMMGNHSSATQSASTTTASTPSTERATPKIAKPEEDNNSRRASVTTAASSPFESLSAAFMEDVNYPDGTIVQPGSTVLKVNIFYFIIIFFLKNK